MRIALVCPSFYPQRGGVETVVMNTAKQYAEMGLDISILTMDNKSSDEIMYKIKILRFQKIRITKNIYFSLDLIRYLKFHSKHFDIIHVHNYHSFSIIAAALTKHAPLVFSPHYHGSGSTFFTNLLHYPYRFIAKFFFNKVDAIICDTQAEESLLKSHFNLENKKIYNVPFGVNFRKKKSNEKKQSSNYILAMGRLEKTKNFDLLIHSFKFLKLPFYLKIVGEGSEFNKLKQIVNENNLQKKVFFLKNVSDNVLVNLRRNAALFVSLSQNEAFGLSILEAVAEGVAIVASDIPSHREIMKLFKIRKGSLVNLGLSPLLIAKEFKNMISKSNKKDNIQRTWRDVSLEMLEIYKKVVS